MRSGLKDGVLVPPASLPAALDRHRRLGLEIERITLHLRDPARDDEWRARAGAKRAAFRDEQAQLGDWIATERARLFRQAYDLLKAFQTDGADFDAAELDQIQRLDAYFAATAPPQAKVQPNEEREMPPKAQQKKQDEEQETQFQIVSDLAAAKEIAEHLFGIHCTPATVFEVFDNMPIEEDVAGGYDGYEEQLKKAQEIAGEMFGASAKVDATTVLGIYTRVLADLDDDEEGDEE
jgi:hypothetical protein